jgi:hypothetical protein
MSASLVRSDDLEVLNDAFREKMGNPLGAFWDAVPSVGFPGQYPVNATRVTKLL